MSRYLLDIIYNIKQQITDGDAQQLAVAHGASAQLALAPFTKVSATVLFSVCQNELDLSPFTARMSTSTRNFKSSPTCVCLLALVDLSDLHYLQLPMRHAKLVEVFRETRNTRSSICLTEVKFIARAKAVLHEYCHCRDTVCANAQFLSVAGCRAESNMDTRLGRIVDDSVETMKAKGKDQLLHGLNPNHLQL